MMDAWVYPVVGAMLGFLGLCLILLVVIGIAQFIRWRHERKIIFGKLDRQMRQRLADYVKREVLS